MESNMITVGLCAGRHDLPVDTFIFDKIDDPTDVNWINAKAYEWVLDNCSVCVGKKAFLSSPLTVYVTGLTVALTAVIRACALCDVPLRLMHYDRANSGYVCQQVL